LAIKNVGAIIFDFDGVLVESMDIKARAFAYLFRDFPDRVEEIVEFHMIHGGMPRFEKFERIYRDILHLPLTAEKKAELGGEFSKFVFEQVVKCPFVNGAREFLGKYSARYPLFVVSGTPDGEIKEIVKKRGLEKYFKEVLGSPLKKAAHNLNIVKKYGFKPEEVVFVGDSIDDWEGVKGTGIKFIGRILEDDPFKGLNVDAVINDLFDLEKIINAKE
jgi:phosphoglycolate phosphatase-like HAD superfamily hydrolase